jgi:hypothetical protein
LFWTVDQDTVRVEPTTLPEEATRERKRWIDDRRWLAGNVIDEPVTLPVVTLEARGNEVAFVVTTALGTWHYMIDFEPHIWRASPTVAAREAVTFKDSKSQT